MHNMSVQTGASITTQGSLGCTFCHAPHSGIGGNTPLWNQKLSNQSYTTYTSTTYHQQGSSQPTLGAASSLCLSCHDGTVAVGQTQAYGQIPMTGHLNNMDSFWTSLTGSHPFSLVLPIKDSGNLAASLVIPGHPADPTGAIKLVNGNIECNTCHNPHSQYIDPVAQNFLVTDSSNGKMCLACHDPNRILSGQPNQLTGWQASIHATATNQVASTGNVGLYPTVSVNSCTSCHMEHDAPSPARLLRPATPAATSVDPATQDCITCHSSTSSSSSINSYINPVPPPVYNELTKTYAHPAPSGSNAHDATETAVLNNNRHATCVDCHNPHATQATVLPFPNPPALRLPQTLVTGVSALDGTTVLAPAVNQYESCLRCHGTSLGKQAPIKYGYLPTRLVFSADALSVLPQFSPTATSSHPVMHTRSSAFAQPSLLPNMMDLDGITVGRPMGQEIMCTDCHNSDDNREFGGIGPNGPHGSNYSHILERNYQFSQATIPGGTVNITFPSPIINSAQGPYALCAKCHNLSVVLSSVSTPLSPPAAPLHVTHVQTDGFTCSVCHTAHGMGANSSTVTGERLVNFDVSVVAPNNGIISYNHGSGTCVLVCHNTTHNADGSVH